MARIAFKKLGTRRSLGVTRLTVVAEYSTREEADACTLDGTVYPVIQANKLLAGK
jgi:hypothetical protein